MTARLEGKSCIITGSGGPVGRATALRFAQEGAEILGADLDETSDAETARLVRAAGGIMHSMGKCDLAETDNCRAVARYAVDTFGKLDILVNNASGVAWSEMPTISDEDWNVTIEGELNHVFRMTRAAWPALSERGGTIVNLGSTAAWLGYKLLGSSAHCAAKAGVVAFTRQLAVEGRTHAIRANSLSPGVIETPRYERIWASPEVAEAVTANIMCGRPGTLDEIANVILFLASDESSYINGADISVDGGVTAW